MEKLKILTNKENIRLNDDIVHSFKQSLDVKVKKNNSTSIELELEENSPSQYDIIAKVISNYIVENIEKDIIKEVVYDECDGLPENYIEDLLGRIEWEILYKEDNDSSSRKSELNKQISKIIQKGGTFSFEGFLRFRFKDRFIELTESIYALLESVLTEKSIEDFTSIVKKLIRVQLPKIDSIHIIILDDGKCEVITSEAERINLQDLEDSLNEANSDIEYELTIIELLVSTLMSLLPRDVYIHCESDDNKIFSVIKKIYDGRCHKCLDCELCDKVKNGESLEGENDQE